MFQRPVIVSHYYNPCNPCCPYSISNCIESPQMLKAICSGLILMEGSRTLNPVAERIIFVIHGSDKKWILLPVD